MEWRDDHHCLACGSENPIGLKLDFQLEGQRLTARWRADKRFQGYAGVVHGGMIALVLDEVMVNLPWRRDGTPVVSAQLVTRFKKPAKVGELLTFTAEAGPPGRLVETSGWCLNEAGEIVAEASARCVRIQLT